ncbi:hypothetical protein Glove_99g386 [Diversispora epigaea]|uniref:Uncharacterized protein n=1 Tax=Diversispora epigaea TaxID=1348612 RepID=A0A397J4U6_9GLOM|nr:hypothetical protein Glove_99g386 [Diversispora epigaea]
MFEKFQEYCIFDSLTEQVLANIITMLCMYFTKVTIFHITNKHVMRYAKGHEIDKVITNSILRDLGISDIKWFNLFLKLYSIKPSDLYELGTNYTTIIYKPENLDQKLNIHRLKY